MLWMMLHGAHYWQQLLLAEFLRRRQLLALKAANRYRNPSGPDTAVLILARGTSRETGRIPICSFHPLPIAARFPICASPSRTVIRG
jgi:hypothetical protein